ncbi:uncharacterized protein [Coffea arabica]|uniref:Uncharacterized protein n=1 Tax=Coffea arabica TaxID=13443 RepID=A0A6P6VFB2_COFAR|nr:uncharacterized protein LOC113721678 [Coffea arabica]
MLGFSAAVASLSPVSTDVVNLAAVLATPRVLRAVTALPLFVRITNTISPSNLEHLSSMMMSLRSNSCSSVKAMAKAGALSAPTTPARGRKHALISLSDKTDVAVLGSGLQELGIAAGLG